MTQNFPIISKDVDERFDGKSVDLHQYEGFFVCGRRGDWGLTVNGEYITHFRRYADAIQRGREMAK